MVFSKNNSNFIKGFAIMLVMAAHYSQWYLAEGNQATMVFFLLSKLGRYGVALFFAISGYGLVISAEKGLNKQFLIRRLANTYFPYIVIQGGILLIGTRPIFFWDIMELLLGIKAWFVCVIIVFYFLFYMAWKSVNHKITFLSVGVVIVSVAFALIWQDEVWYSSNISFVLGVIAGYYRNVILRVNCKKIWMCLGAGAGFAVSVIIYTVCAGNNNVVYLFFKIIASALWVVFALLFYSIIKMPKNVFVEQIGRTSLEIYLLHMTVLEILGNVIPDKNIFRLILSIIVTILFAIVLNQIFNKVRQYCGMVKK